MAKESVIAAAKFSATELLSANNKPSSICTKDFQLSAQIDPFDAKSAGSSLSKCFDVKIRALDGSPLEKVSAAKVRAKAEECSSAICLRLPVPVVISIKGKNELQSVQAEFIATLPDPGTLVRYDLARGPCIKRENKLTFSNGMLTKADLQKPSELLACLSIPVALVKQIGEIPGALLTARVNVTNLETTNIKAQSDYYAAMSTLIKNQAELLRLSSGK